MTGTPRLLDIWLKRMERLRDMREDASSPRRAWVCDVRLRVLDYMVSRYGEDDPASPSYPRHTPDSLEDDFESLPMQVTFTADGAWMPTDEERASLKSPPKDTQKFSKVLRNIASANVERSKQYAAERGKAIQNMTLPPFETFKIRVTRVEPEKLIDFPGVVDSPTWVAASTRWNSVHRQATRRYAFMVSMISEQGSTAKITPDKPVNDSQTDLDHPLHQLAQWNDRAMNDERIGDIPIGAVQFTRVEGLHPDKRHRSCLDSGGFDIEMDDLCDAAIFLDEDRPCHTWFMHSLVGRNLPWLSTFLPGLLEFAEISLTHGLFQGQMVTRCTPDLHQLLLRLDWEVNLDLTSPFNKNLPVVMTKVVG